MMSRVVGTRVIRGPDWTWGDQDGGEHHVGTITDVIKNDPDNDNGDEAPRAVKVTWDVGKKGNYRVGYEQQYDLRLYDNSTVGVLHKFVRCMGCASEDIAGIRWRCTVCTHCNLCTECYMSDSHDIEHEFLRIDMPHDPGVVVKARNESKSVRSHGIFAGAKVSRGPHWSAGKQDGGRKNVGTVTDVCDWSECFKKCAATVKWMEDAEFKYRVGFEGKVEIKAVEAAAGIDIYETHLPLIGESETWKKGEKVMVAMDTEMLKIFQEEIGEHWDNSLIEKIGRSGCMEAVDHRGWVQLTYDDKTDWTMPPFALKKLVELKADDRVRIIENIDMIQDLHRNNKRISNDIEMGKCAGEEGSVLETTENDDLVKIKVKGQTLRYHHAALILLPKRDGDDGGADEDAEVMEGKEENKEEKDDDEEHSSHSQEEKKSEEGYENIITNAPEDYPKPKPIPEKAGPGDKDAMHRWVEKIAEKLKDAGVSVAVSSDERHMVKAAAEGNLEKVKEFLRQDSKLANASIGTRTALQVASHEGFLPIVQLLVDAHASLEQKDSDGDTALAYAVIGNNPSVADFLLNREAYINTANKRRRTPLHISAHNDHKSCVEILIKHGGSVNMQDENGNLPIHVAVRCKSTSLVDLFINHPLADLKMRNNDGFTPLHYAAKKDCLEVVKQLVARDPSLASIQKDDGYTPLDVAAINNHVDIVRVLIELRNCDISSRIGHRGSFSPLHLATWQGYTEVVELLVDHGADLNVKDKDGDTMLHLGAKRRKSGRKYVQDTPTMRKICEEIGDPAITTARDALMAYFIRHGSDVTIENNDGQTPFDLLKKEPVLRTALMKVAGITPVQEEVQEEVKVEENEVEEKMEEKEDEKDEKERKPSTPNIAKKEKQKADIDFEGVHRIRPDELDLGKTVGRGGFGEVKKATWRGTTVAVKILPTAGSKESEVEKEVSIHKRARHPNIVSLMAVGHQLDQALIVMEFIDGKDLHDIIFRKRENDAIDLTPELKMSITLGLLSALTFLHASKILHLDIKPSNIMVERSSKRAYLCDLGLAHIKTRSSMCLSTSVRGPRGTITHMAPEMVEREGKAWAGPGNDIWSIACTFLELFVEKRLWEGAEFMAIMRTLVKPATVPPILKKAKSEIRTILKPCFEREPLKRPSAEVLLEQFQKLQSGS